MFDVNRRTVTRLAVGDVVAILAFVTVGEYQHNEYLFSASRLPELAAHLVGTGVPFLAGWVLGAWALSAYGDVESRTRLVGTTVSAWLVADVVGQLIRGTAAFPGDASITFFAVAGLFGAVFLLAWRLVATTLLGP